MVNYEEKGDSPPFRIKRKRRDKTTCPFCTKKISKKQRMEEGDKKVVNTVVLQSLKIL